MFMSNRIVESVHIVLALLLAVLMPQSGAFAAVIHVPGDYSTIQAAINAAATNDTVEVADGTYSGSGNVNLSLTKQITVRSANGASNCTIDCSGGQNRAFAISGSTTILETIVEGFSILNGNRGDGASALFIGSPATIRNCAIGDCQAGYNITGWVFGTVHCGSDCVIDGCTISNNSAIFAAGINIGNDAATMTVTIRDTTILENTAVGIAGGIWANFSGTRLDMINCVVKSNIASTDTVDAWRGGGIAVANEADAHLVNCVISHNRVDNPNGNEDFIAGGGGISVLQATLQLTNCVISNNEVEAAIQGGGILNSGGFVKISDCTIAGNNGGRAGGGYCDGERLMPSTAIIENTILYGNLADSGEQIQLDDPSSETDVKYSDVQGGLAGVGGTSPQTYANNISADPGFVDATNGIYTIKWTSPCHNTGDSSLVPCDEFDLDDDTFACAPSTGEHVPYDLAAPHAREICRVDRGAFEVQEQPLCPGDCTGGGDNPPDGMVNIDDLVAVIINWSQPGGYADIAPFPCGSGSVDIDDLVAVITGWGSCPVNGQGGGGAVPQSVSDCLNWYPLGSERQLACLESLELRGQ